MKESSNLKNLIVIGAILIAIAGAVYFYISRDQSSDELLTSQDSGAVTGTVDSDLLAALKELRKLHLDDSIFSDPAWLSLHDFGKVLVPQQAFRPNPFAPLDASAFAGTTTAPAGR